jgi:diguanylate cyclase (GGDEF)-like protein
MSVEHGIGRQVTAWTEPKEALGIGIIVFICSVFGIQTAPLGALAAFWPTNAVLLGLLLRRTRAPTSLHWIAAIFGYMLADLYMSHGWAKSTMLTCANLMGVWVCYRIFSRMSADYRAFRHPRSMLWFIAAVAAGSTAAGVGGFFIHPPLFGSTPAYGFMIWFSTELVNYIAILPVMLTIPGHPGRWLEYRRRSDRASVRLAQVAPLLAFAGSLWLGTRLGGPGVIPYPIPAMLWCALTYSMFATAGITLFFSMWTLIAISSGTLIIGANFDSQQAITSLRVGVILTALAPLTVASVMMTQKELLSRLKHSASHDPLTNILNRGGFMTSAETLLDTPRSIHWPVGVLMMDIDFFKKINDTYGHAAGDVVLTGFADLANACLRKGDLLGRLGGEEFAVLLPKCSQEDALAIAQRICDAFAGHSVTLDNFPPLRATVSIGVAHCSNPAAPIEVMLSWADAALYNAKNSGRNQVLLSDKRLAGA